MRGNVSVTDRFSCMCWVALNSEGAFQVGVFGFSHADL